MLEIRVRLEYGLRFSTAMLVEIRLRLESGLRFSKAVLVEIRLRLECGPRICGPELILDVPTVEKLCESFL